MAHARAADAGDADENSVVGGAAGANVRSNSRPAGSSVVGAPSSGAAGEARPTSTGASALAVDAATARFGEAAREASAADDSEEDGDDGSSAQSPAAQLRQEGAVQLPAAVDMLEQLEIG